MRVVPLRDVVHRLSRRRPCCCNDPPGWIRSDARIRSAGKYGRVYHVPRGGDLLQLVPSADPLVAGSRAAAFDGSCGTPSRLGRIRTRQRRATRYGAVCLLSQRRLVCELPRVRQPTWSRHAERLCAHARGRRPDVCYLPHQQLAYADGCSAAGPTLPSLDAARLALC